jgi:hypothetical protein
MPSPLERTDPPFMILDPLMIDVATLGEEPEMTLETLGYHIEVAPCLDGLGTHAFFEPLKPPIDVREPLVDFVEPPVDFGEARIDSGEALVDVSLHLPDRHVGRVFVGHPTIVLRELCPGRSERKRGGFRTADVTVVARTAYVGLVRIGNSCRAQQVACTDRRQPHD